MTTIYSTSNLPASDPGFRLTDALDISNAINNANGRATASGITAAGSSQTGAVQLTAVLNEVDTVAAGTGVQLPLSTGKATTPYQTCAVFNNGANPLQIYGSTLGTDTINGQAATVGTSLPANSTALFLSAKKGAWSQLGIGVGDSVGGVAAAFTQTSNTTLTTVSGLSATLTAGGTYAFEIYISGTAGASGGIKINLGSGGTATATSFNADQWTYNTTTVASQGTTSTFNSSLVAYTGAFTTINIIGTIVVNAGGTFVVQAAQNVSNGTATTISLNSNIVFTRLA